MIISGSNGTTVSGSLRPVGNRRDRQRLARWVGPGSAQMAWPAGICTTRLAVVR